MLHLKELRERKQLTQSELSKLLGISPSTIGMYEQGRREPDNETLKKIAVLFGVSTDYLLGNEPPQHEYYHDPEVAAIAQEMHDNPDIKVLFHATKGMKKESIEEIRKFVEFQKAKENGFMEWCDTPRIVYMNLPYDCRGYVTTNADGYYTVVLNARMSYDMNVQTYVHELKHIYYDDFRDGNVGDIEKGTM